MHNMIGACRPQLILSKAAASLTGYFEIIFLLLPEQSLDTGVCSSYGKATGLRFTSLLQEDTKR